MLKRTRQASSAQVLLGTSTRPPSEDVKVSDEIQSDCTMVTRLGRHDMQVFGVRSTLTVLEPDQSKFKRYLLLAPIFGGHITTRAGSVLLTADTKIWQRIQATCHESPIPDFRAESRQHEQPSSLYASTP